MASILRLAAKDRTSFFFRRQQQDSTDNGTNNFAHSLPDISQSDDISFTDLFDHFKNFESLEGPDDHLQGPGLVGSRMSAKGLAETAPNDLPPSGQHLGAVHPLSSHPLSATAAQWNQIERNDSTGSSNSSRASQRDCDYSPKVTRNSSNSSYTFEPPSATSRSDPEKQKSLSVYKRTSKPLSPGYDKEKIVARTSRAAKTSSIVIVSLPPNTDKPLPQGPLLNPSLSAPNLLMGRQMAELPSECRVSRNVEAVFKPAPRAVSQPEKIVSVRSASVERGVPSPALSEPQSTRERKNARHVSVTHQRKRSISDTGLVGKYIPRHASPNHTLPPAPQRPPPAIPPSHRLSRVHQRQSSGPISASTAERVIYKIMCQLHSLADLQATAMVSKGFYRTYLRNESKIVSHINFNKFKPAWELRRSLLALKGSTRFAMKDCLRDQSTITTLKAFIVARCGTMCKRSTIVGLTGENERRSHQIDNALWRIWTFCTLFGTAPAHPESSQAQTNWLNGSKAKNHRTSRPGTGVGNGTGLSTAELEDMSDMWHCLQSLVSGFSGREQEARHVGIFDNLQENCTEQQHLAEWISYLLALGPQIVLSVSSCSFDQAKMLGLTNSWTLPAPGESRSSFLADAISQVYKERLLEEAVAKAAQFALPRKPMQRHRPTRSVDERQLPSSQNNNNKAFPHSQTLRIDTSTVRPRPVSTIFPPSEPRIEIRPDCDPRSALVMRNSALFPASPTADPTAYHALSMTTNASAKLGATLFPMAYAIPSPQVPIPQPMPIAPSSGIVDPVDKAMELLVKQLGFRETNARKALAMCDTGSGIDLHKAIELLTIDAKEQQDYFTPIELPTPLDAKSHARTKRQTKEYCNGQCVRERSVKHIRHRSNGNTTDGSISPISDENEWQDTITALPSAAENLKRGPSKSNKAWKVLGLDRKDSGIKRRTSVLGINEYKAKVERRKSMREAASPSLGLKDGIGKNLMGLGLGLGVGSATSAKTIEEQLGKVREQERQKKEANLVRYA